MNSVFKQSIAAFGLLLSLSVPTLAGLSEDAVAAYGRGDYLTAVKLWRQLAEAGDATAQYRVGLMYNNGEGVPQDYAEGGTLVSACCRARRPQSSIPARLSLCCRQRRAAQRCGSRPVVPPRRRPRRAQGAIPARLGLCGRRGVAARLCQRAHVVRIGCRARRPQRAKSAGLDHAAHEPWTDCGSPEIGTRLAVDASTPMRSRTARLDWGWGYYIQSLLISRGPGI
jgi:hypothetical protein